MIPPNILKLYGALVFLIGTQTFCFGLYSENENGPPTHLQWLIWGSTILFQIMQLFLLVVLTSSFIAVFAQVVLMSIAMVIIAGFVFLPMFNKAQLEDSVAMKLIVGINIGWALLAKVIRQYKGLDSLVTGTVVRHAVAVVRPVVLGGAQHGTSSVSKEGIELADLSSFAHAPEGGQYEQQRTGFSPSTHRSGEQSPDSQDMGEPCAIDGGPQTTPQATKSGTRSPPPAYEQ